MDLQGKIAVYSPTPPQLLKIGLIRQDLVPNNYQTFVFSNVLKEKSLEYLMMESYLRVDIMALEEI